MKTTPRSIDIFLIFGHLWCHVHGGYSSVVEHQIVVLGVAGSNPLPTLAQWSFIAGAAERAPDPVRMLMRP